MRTASLSITLLIALLTLGVWSLLNQPDEEPPWPERIQGFAFSPMRADQTPLKNQYPSVEEIDQDLALLEGRAHAVRTYSLRSTLAEIPRLVRARGLNLALGAWLDGDLESNDEELDRLIQLARQNHRGVVRVIVGNEVLLRKELSVDQMIAYLDRVKSKVWAPVSLAEPWHIWLRHPELVQHVDYIAVHLLPYWEGVGVGEAVEYVVARYQELKQAFPDKPIVIAEVGWPSNGRTRKEAVASVANQATFLRRFLARAEQENYTYYLMEAFDQPWKRAIEGAIGTYWGVYDVDRNPKFKFTEPVVRIPEWRELAALSIVIAIVILVLLFRDSATLHSRGRGFLALIAYATATTSVWLIYDYTRQYMTLESVLVGFLLLAAMLGVIVVLLAEAHEWAEALWLREWRRAPRPIPMDEKELPLVSIHVPAYNEPPTMLIETLNALAAMDYPRFEVIVMDNNTRDPAVWKPVQAHCRQLGERFRFFHEPALDGFKAGALNYALRESHPEAEIVAVIDSDYQVERDWLRDLVPQFRRPRTAIVQAPQDYRDGAQNGFKAMCFAEYRGFFHIGMITRNERNAIIQHGTMTMVRRRVLEEVGGWGEWSITEDAELGLRIFELGYEAVYVPRSYGRGLMPDTFVDFKKQRFRWAFGAVQILRRHLRELLGWRPSALSQGQRYHFVAGWLPWFADGFNLLFNLAALGWSTAMIVAPDRAEPPLVIFALLPLSLFVFKIIKMFFLYRRRVDASLRQSVAAALAGLALSHTIARAVLSGLSGRRVGFFRTPKMARAHRLLRAVGDAREESLFLLALSLAAFGVLWQQDSDMFDVRVWVVVLLVQSVPYAATLLLSLISALPRLPAGLVGTMGAMADKPPAPVTKPRRLV